MRRSMTRGEVARRNRPQDAALIIDNVVYDVTQFLEHHPGGVEVLLDYAGKDASRCFADVGHSDDARLLRAQYELGDVVPHERRPEVATPPPQTPPPAEQHTLRGLLDVWGPPLALAALALLVYHHLLT